MNFKEVTIPDGEIAYIPDDINIEFPGNADIAQKDLHFLTFIPWDEKYLAFVPEEYIDFFKFVLPHLGVRTTDVHTAVCLPLLAEMLKSNSKKLDERLVYIGLILHDCGWSKVDERGIADSLSYSGLALSAAAKASKNQHQVVGAELATEILSAYSFTPPLNKQEEDQIHEIVLNHDIPKNLIDQGAVSDELYFVCDADRLWSYTHENFWQDTIRKGVEPRIYASNLENELEGYFYTPQGKAIAHRLLADRKKEVASYPAK